MAKDVDFQESYRILRNVFVVSLPGIPPAGRAAFLHYNMLSIRGGAARHRPAHGGDRAAGSAAEETGRNGGGKCRCPSQAGGCAIWRWCGRCLEMIDKTRRPAGKCRTAHNFDGTKREASASRLAQVFFQYIFAPAGMWLSSISRCSFSSPFS